MTKHKNVLYKILSWYKKFQVSKSPQMNLVWGFFLYTVIGFLLLSIPIFHKTSVSFLDTLFISTSAISTTGLVTVSVYDSYNFFGQLIVMVLFQIGGIGYMTLTTYYLLFTTQKIGHWHKKVVGAEFTLPKTIKIRDFVKSVIVFTLIMEVIGAICFFIAFRQTGMETLKAVWFSVFHSVSAFCTAGFGLFNNSFESYSSNALINTIISVLAIAGSLGFIVITDLWYRITGKSNSVSFTTKIITYGFVILLFLGTTLVYFTEPSIRSSDSRLVESFFQAMTAMTTVGFNTISTGNLSLPILLFVTFLMYIGASPSGTAGGMKITTLTAMISILKSRLFGQKRISFLNRTIPFERLYVATSTFMMYTSIIFLFTFLLTFTERFEFQRILFEVASALGTVGLSTGITGDLSNTGKALTIVLMFIGRVGVLTFGFALLERKNKSKEESIEDDLAV
ncbi:V-type sodium ATP synthase subunit J (Na(+)-translocating ATPase subunit J) [Microscilla marina ATCC 23134]|uniref:V-type sodium ATP synthase subunit J (Na(+)-translocating ATPase subunit J) n=2 Tax=Microscilla marina TaxID=1027 RepID=A1ZDU6_MICM2|nr:V-type sodium ATP synthase subunit J (Na(+)-translocating ATPase subunit J) [Microscilla marina ATCC 23134]